MPLPTNANLDAVTRFVSDHTTAAIRKWLDGRPRDEPSIMNHLTGHLSKSRRGCDVGMRSKLLVHSKIFELHRKGRKSADRYGADFAVTISFHPSEYTKTALFQVKVGSKYRAELELEQLEQMMEDSRVAARAFVLYVNEDRIGVRIRDAKTVRDDFDPKNKKSQTYDTIGWQSETEWLLDWMKCDVGEETKLNARNPIEATLASLEHNPKRSAAADTLPYPVNAWLVQVFAPERVEYDDTAFARHFEQWQEEKT